MCGIAGIINLNKNNLNLAKVANCMNDTLRHRGPDGEGYLLISNDTEITAYGKDTSESIIQSDILQKPTLVLENRDNLKGILAHRRLSIIDITATGHQPLCNISKTLWIVFNGEVYNYLELREELIKKGHKFHTSSDTEVILEAYSEWGYECVNRFNGMWAFVIYDKNKNQLFASRDRFGVKPFYYCKNENIFAFASEQKALVASGITAFKPNDKAIFDYWLFSYMEEEEEGMFKEIYELFPSHSLTLDLATGEIKKWKYYTLPYSNKFEDKELNVKLYLDKVLAYTMESIWVRLRSDVEVGCCLSGGLDSSSIVSSIYEMRKVVKDKKIDITSILLSKQGIYGNAVNTFTASFDNPLIDESHYAQIVSDHTHSNAHYVKPNSGELLKDLHDLIYCQDIPIWSTSTYAQFRVMQLIKENGIKVVLDGQGGDELFAGYESYYFYHFRDLALQGKTFINEALATGRFWQLQKRYFRQLALNKFINHLPLSQQLNLRLKAHPELRYLNRDFLQENIKRLKKGKDTYTLNGVLNRDFNNTLLKSYLKCEDRCSMWHSVEARTPFSDDIKLIEYIFSLPSSVKIQNGKLKQLLREAMRGITPDAILKRKDKKGYLTPNRQWISEIRNGVRSVFENKNISEFLDQESILRDYDKLFNQPAMKDNGRIFKLIAFSKWMEIFSNLH